MEALRPWIASGSPWGNTSGHHWPTFVRVWHPEEFDQLGQLARDLGLVDVRSGPLVRSSYHAAGCLRPNAIEDHIVRRQGPSSSLMSESSGEAGR